MRQHPPRASGAQHIADGIHHLPAGVFDGTAAGFGRRQQRFQQLPLPVVQVGGVIWSVHTPRLRHSARSSPSCLYASFYLFRHPLRQRIFQQPFSWREMGVDVRGRSQNLRINYRTSHQIRTQADRLLDPELSDVDGNTEERRGTVSVFNGPNPTVSALEDEKADMEAVAKWLVARIEDGTDPDEIGVFVRSSEQIDRAVATVRNAGLPYNVLDDGAETADGAVHVGTMHLAKGLEFRAVAVIACDAEVIPLQSRVESIVDDADLEEVYNTERNLLYVACTRARDHLLVTGVKPVSEFLDDLSNNDE